MVIRVQVGGPGLDRSEDHCRSEDPWLSQGADWKVTCLQADKALVNGKGFGSVLYQFLRAWAVVGLTCFLFPAKEARVWEQNCSSPVWVS